MENEFEFSDIINKRRPEHIGDEFSHKYPKMRRCDRAKIFAPYSALHGFGELTDEKRVKTQSLKDFFEDTNDIC